MSGTFASFVPFICGLNSSCISVLYTVPQPWMFRTGRQLSRLTGVKCHIQFAFDFLIRYKIKMLGKGITFAWYICGLV